LEETLSRDDVESFETCLKGFLESILADFYVREGSDELIYGF